MGHTGTVKGNVIVLDKPLLLADGTRVEVAVTPKLKPRRGSPQALLQLAGTLSVPAVANMAGMRYRRMALIEER